MDASPPVVVITDGHQPLLRRTVARVRPPLWLIAPDEGFAAAANTSTAPVCITPPKLYDCGTRCADDSG